MNEKIFQVDAFTSEIFCGNPAVVCILESKRTDKWMQSFAAEMNLSETAFILQMENGYDLRWFTPKQEVELCGHATLASAWILFTENCIDQDQEIVFSTKSGNLKAKIETQKIVLDFPRFDIQGKVKNDELLEALGIKEAQIWGMKTHTIVEIADPDQLRKLKPDFGRLEKIAGGEAAVTCLSDDPRYDFLSRFFAPGFGINEDPVTGSSHCSLGPFWAERLRKKKLSAFQASARGGTIDILVKEKRVELSGNAVTVWRGDLG